MSEKIGAAQANALFASPYIPFSVECSTTLYNITFL